MTTETTTIIRPADLRSHNGLTMFLADWVDATFIHFALDPAVLQPHVPFPPDVTDGRAYVSLVAFTQRRLRPAVGGRLAALLAAPLAEHPFLNLRTYVRVGGEPAIHFLSEWIPNRLAVLIGPATYGLPYQLGQLRYGRRNDGGEHVGTVRCRGKELSFATGTNPALRQRILDESGSPGSLDDFLLERYAAWTMCDGVARRFRIWHEPWTARRCAVELSDRSLVDAAAPWLRCAMPALAHRTDGVRDVWIGAPERVDVGRNSRPDRTPCGLIHAGP